MLPMNPTDTCTLRIAPKVWKYVTGRQNAPRIISAGYLGCVSHKKQPSSKSLLQIDLLIGSASFLDTELLGPMAQAHLCSFSRNTDKESFLSWSTTSSSPNAFSVWHTCPWESQKCRKDRERGGTQSSGRPGEESPVLQNSLKRHPPTCFFCKEPS